jgi:hypothetical protein
MQPLIHMLSMTYILTTSLQILNKMSQLLVIARAQNASIMAKNRETKSIKIFLRLAPHCWPL